MYSHVTHSNFSLLINNPSPLTYEKVLAQYPILQNLYPVTNYMKDVHCFIVLSTSTHFNFTKRSFCTA